MEEKRPDFSASPSRRAALTLLAGLSVVAGCNRGVVTSPGPPPPLPPPAAAAVQVTDLQLGNALGPDKRVKTPMTSFSPRDTILASVVTEGTAPLVELTARWTFQDGQVVNESKRSFAPSGTAVTEFIIEKPEGWPVGEYRVEISLDGKLAQQRAFVVKES
jgi:hypothetical protein